MDHFISLSEAAEMTARYRQHRNEVLQPSFQGRDLLPICETFDRQAFEILLSKPSCAFVRIYYGMDADLKIHGIIVAADSKEHDILPSASFGDAEEEQDIIDRANRCPDLCPPESALNS